METLQQTAIPTSPMKSARTVGNHASICSRCRGLLVETFCISPAEGGAEFQIQVMKCLQCGDFIDSAILENRQRASFHQLNHN